MILLDHDIPQDQVDQLRRWRIHFRQAGIEVGRPEWDDQQEILRYLRSLRHATFFTCDLGFYRRRFRHAQSCIVAVDTIIAETATLIRRFLRHSKFKTKRKRSGLVVRLAPSKITVWKAGAEHPSVTEW